jgi:hypothetical protein
MVSQTIPKAIKLELGLDEKAKGPIIGNYTDWDSEGQAKPSAGWGQNIKPAKAFQNREKPSQPIIWDGADDEDSIPF